MRDALADVLNEIEAELRCRGRWDACRPSDAALSSTQPFAVDFLTFDQWLQWILLPRLRDLLAREAPLPSDCAIRPMAEEIYGEQAADARRLIALLGRVDRLLTFQSGTPD